MGVVYVSRLSMHSCVSTKASGALLTDMHGFPIASRGDLPETSAGAAQALFSEALLLQREEASLPIISVLAGKTKLVISSDSSHGAILVTRSSV